MFDYDLLAHLIKHIKSERQYWELDHPDYLNEYCRYYKEGIVELRKQWDWMICPFEIEFEVAPVGGSWYDKKEYVLK